MHGRNSQESSTATPTGSIPENNSTSLSFSSLHSLLRVPSPDAVSSVLDWEKDVANATLLQKGTKADVFLLELKDSVDRTSEMSSSEGGSTIEETLALRRRVKEREELGWPRCTRKVLLKVYLNLLDLPPSRRSTAGAVARSFSSSASSPPPTLVLPPSTSMSSDDTIPFFNDSMQKEIAGYARLREHGSSSFYRDTTSHFSHNNPTSQKVRIPDIYGYSLISPPFPTFLPYKTSPSPSSPQHWRSPMPAFLFEYLNPHPGLASPESDASIVVEGKSYQQQQYWQRLDGLSPNPHPSAARFRPRVGEGGGELSLKLANSLDEPSRKTLLKKLIQSLEALHQRDILHGDIRPSNVLVGFPNIQQESSSPPPKKRQRIEKHDLPLEKNSSIAPSPDDTILVDKHQQQLQAKTSVQSFSPSDLEIAWLDFGSCTVRDQNLQHDFSASTYPSPLTSLNITKSTPGDSAVSTSISVENAEKLPSLKGSQPKSSKTNVRHRKGKRTTPAKTWEEQQEREITMVRNRFGKLLGLQTESEEIDTSD